MSVSTSRPGPRLVGSVPGYGASVPSGSCCPSSHSSTKLPALHPMGPLASFQSLSPGRAALPATLVEDAISPDMTYVLRWVVGGGAPYSGGGRRKVQGSGKEGGTRRRGGRGLRLDCQVDE